MTGPKLRHLRQQLRSTGEVALAFSGGVDSSFLLRIAADVMPGRVLALTAVSVLVPDPDREDAREIARATATPYYEIPFPALELPHFAENTRERCYLCKKALYVLLLNKARELGTATLIDGTNADDLKDFRPGLRAAGELSVRPPLAEAGLSKHEIRILSRELGLPTWDKPSSPCLATRFPYGEPITAEAVARVKDAEAYLRGMGYTSVRVRSRGSGASIEIEAGEIARFMEQDRTEHIIAHVRQMGFAGAELDMRGYRSGSLDVEPPASLPKTGA